MKRIVRRSGREQQVGVKGLLEEKVRSGEGDFRRFADSAPFPVWISNPNLERVYFNQAWLQVTGRTLEEEAGGGWLQGVHPNDVAQVQAAFRKAAETPGEIQVQYRLRDSQGEFRHFLDNGFPRFSSEGELVGYVGATADHSLFEQTLREFQRLQHEHGELLHALNHDIKAPLRAVEGFAEALREDWGESLTGEASDFLQEILDGAGRLRGLIEDLVEFGRLGKDGLSAGAVDSREAIDEALSAMRSRIQESGARIEVKGNFPLLSGKRRTLVVLFEQLIDNAIKFVAPGLAPEVVVEGIDSGSQAVFRVKDRGIGMSPAHLEEVFGVFRRLHVPSEYPGSGIGLALAKKAVDLHNGRIEVHPNPEGGVTVEVQLPRIGPPRGSD